MKRRSIQNGPAPHHSATLHQRLNLYSLAASAAGVGALALAHPAEARIVYTHAHKKIVFNHGPIYFDLNHDGVNDFSFYGHSSQTTSGGSAFLNIGPQAGNGIWSMESARHTCAAALPKGKRVGPSAPFNTHGVNMFFRNNTAGGKSTAFCPWINVNKSAYLGLKFMIKGKVHFGWARVNFTNGVTLTGYAYETVVNKPILTGKTMGADEADDGFGKLEPSSSSASPSRSAGLGLLATGSAGLLVWRQE